MVLIRHLHATGPSGSGNVTYTDSGGPGTTPIAVRVLATTVSAEDTNTSPARYSEGYYDGTNVRCTAVVHENLSAAAGATASCFADNANLVIGPNANGDITPVVLGAPVSLGTNSVTINWDAAATATMHLDFIFFYGPDCLAVVKTVTNSGAQDSSGSTSGGPGMPNIIFGMTVGSAFVAGSTSSAFGYVDGTISSGFAGRLPSTTQACFGLFWNNNTSPTDVGNVNRSNAICTTMTAAGTEGPWMEVTGWTSDGATYTKRNSGSTIEIAVLEITLEANQKVWCGSPSLPTNTAGAFSRTDPAFQPQALFFSNSRTGANNNAPLNSQGSPCIGFAVSNAQGGISVFSRDNQGTSDTGSRHTLTYCDTIIQTGGAAALRFSFTNFGPQGWTGSINTTTAAATVVPYCAIAANAIISTEVITETINRAVRRSISETLDIDETINRAVRRAINENLDITETVNRAVRRAISETLGITETVHAFIEAAGVQLLKQVSETLDLTELVNRAVRRAISEDLAISESVNRAVRRSVSESLAIDETLHRAVRRSVLEQLDITETVNVFIDTVSGALKKQVSETLFITETINIAFFRSIQEQLDISDLVGRSLTLIRVVDEDLDISETVHAQTGIVAEVSETMNISETVEHVEEVGAPMLPRGTTATAGPEATDSADAGVERGG